MILSLFALCFICSACGLKCGKSKYHSAGEISESESRIIEGKKARPHEFPWQVRLTFQVPKGQWKECGGSIIDKRWVLTAGHCATNNIIKSTLKVIVGEYQKGVNNSNRQIISAESIFNHLEFGSITRLSYDISLIKTKQAIKFNENVLPVCLPKPKELYEHRKVVVTGWGTTRLPSGVFEETLNYVTLNTMTNKDCKKVYRGVTDDMVCAKDNRNITSQGSLKGESGGPLVLKDTKGYFSIVGVDSWGCDCSQNKPSVFARVNYALNWIKKTMHVNEGSELFKHFYIITTILILIN